MKISIQLARFLESHALQVLAQAFTVIGLLLATYITTRLAPILTRLDKLETRVEAFEEKNDYIINVMDKRLERIEDKLYPQQ